MKKYYSWNGKECKFEMEKKIELRILKKFNKRIYEYMIIHAEVHVFGLRFKITIPVQSFLYG